MPSDGPFLGRSAVRLACTWPYSKGHAVEDWSWAAVRCGNHWLPLPAKIAEGETTLLPHPSWPGSTNLPSECIVTLSGDACAVWSTTGCGTPNW